MHAGGLPAPLQMAVLLALLCMLLLIAMWGASQLGFPGIAQVFNLLLLLAVFIVLFFVVTIVIVMLAQLARKLLDLYVSR